MWDVGAEMPVPHPASTSHIAYHTSFSATDHFFFSLARRCGLWHKNSMKAGPYFILLLISLVCVVLSGGLFCIAHINQKLQAELQMKQQALNNGILGPQAQQVTSGILQDMANAAASNPGIRQLLEKNGYKVEPPKTTGAAAPATTDTNSVRETSGKESQEKE